MAKPSSNEKCIRRRGGVGDHAWAQKVGHWFGGNEKELLNDVGEARTQVLARPAVSKWGRKTKGVPKKKKSITKLVSHLEN